MATLQKIRNRAGLLIIVIGVALLAFIIGDGLRSGGTLIQDGKQVVLRVNGEKIKYPEYQSKLEDILNKVERSGQKLNEEGRMQYNNYLFQQYIQGATAKKISKTTGISVTGKEYAALVTGQGVPQSYMARGFFAQFGVSSDDPNAINQIITELSPEKIKQLPAEQRGMYTSWMNEWNNVSEAIINDRILEKYNSIMSRSYAINDVDAQFYDPQESRTVALVRTPSTILSDSTVRATDEQIKKFYDTHKEYYRLQEPYTKVSFIAKEILPSAADREHAKETMLKAVEDLKTRDNVDAVVNQFSIYSLPTTYYTINDLQANNLPTELVDFIKANGKGAVYTPSTNNNYYDILKIVDKIEAAPSITARIIPLDSLNAIKADSIAALINAGKTPIDSLVKQFSAAPTQDGGFITYTDPRTGQPTKDITREAATYSKLDTLFSLPLKKATVLTYNKNKNIFIVESQAAAVPLYKVAYAKIPIEYSDETRALEEQKLDSILLGANKTFSQMEEEAQAKGYEVVKDVKVDASSLMLGNIPDSRSVISWALKNKTGEISKDITVCDNKYLVIASIGEKVTGDYIPLKEVKENIALQLTADNRGDKLAANLEAQKLTSLSAYATAMNSVIDTIPDVTVLPVGSMPPAFYGEAMGTPINTISKPFRAMSEVMVVEPLNETKVATESNRKASIEQKRRSFGIGISNQSLKVITESMKVVDNRGNMY